MVEGGLSTSSIFQNVTTGGVLSLNDSYGIVTNCCNSGLIRGIGSGRLDGSDNGYDITCSCAVWVSGIVGWNLNYSYLSKSINLGYLVSYGSTINLSSSSTFHVRVGGVVGMNNNSSSVSWCYNVGNVTIYGSTSSATGNYTMLVGGVAGNNANSSSVSDCFNVGNVLVYGSTGSASGNYNVYVGGIVGDNYAANVDKCFSVGSVTVYGSIGSGSGYYNIRIGGVVGCNQTSCSVSECYNVGSVLVYGSTGGTTGNYNMYIGGVVGRNDNSSSVSECYNIGSVTVYGSIGSATGGYGVFVGGVVGVNNTSSVDKCFNLGSVTAYGSTSTASGSYWVFVGGVVGLSEGNSTTQCYISNSYNKGNVTGYGWYGVTGSGQYRVEVSGVVGHGTYTTVESCFNEGNVSGINGNFYNFVGGIVGYLTAGDSINNSYNKGSIYGERNLDDTAYFGVGGIAGGVVNADVPLSSTYNSGSLSIYGSGTYKGIGGILGLLHQNTMSIYTGNYWINTCGTSYGNGWYIGGADYAPNNIGTTPMTSSNMKTTSFVTTLNNGSNAWLYDTNNINNGYPILSGTESVRAMETNYINNILSNTTTIPSLLEWIEDTFIPNSNYTTITNQIELIRANTTTLEPIADTSWYKAEEREYHLYNLGDILGIQEILEGTRTGEEVEGLQDKTLYIENDIDIGIL